MNFNTLIKPLAALLRHSVAIHSEYSLIRCLVDRGDLPASYGASSLTMFQTHFRLMNGLYQLQQLWLLEGLYLHISPLEIYLEAKVEGASHSYALNVSGLREFYLDWQHFEAATEDSVDQLLNDFWRTFAEGGVSDDEQAKALAVLELKAPQNFPAIKQQYRRLAMTHHPDRGGDAERLQQINHAMAILTRCYGK